MYFAQNLRLLRKNNDMSQEELADALQYSFRNISKWENNIAIPSYDILLKIANIFNITTKELMEEDLSLKAINKFKLDILKNANLRLEFQREFLRFIYTETSYEQKRTIKYYEDTIEFVDFNLEKKWSILFKKEHLNFNKLFYLIDVTIHDLKLNGYLSFYELEKKENVIVIVYCI